MTEVSRSSVGKAVLAACFVCELGTVLALRLIFAPFTYRTLIFAVGGGLVIGVLPWVTPRFFRAFGGRPSELEAKWRNYEDLFQSLRRQAQERNVTFDTHVLVGHPADQILKSAARHGADMIVVGHRGRSAIRDWVSGSTSRRVFTHATCPVLVVRAR